MPDTQADTTQPWHGLTDSMIRAFVGDDTADDMQDHARRTAEVIAQTQGHAMRQLARTEFRDRCASVQHVVITALLGIMSLLAVLIVARFTWWMWVL